MNCVIELWSSVDLLFTSVQVEDGFVAVKLTDWFFVAFNFHFVIIIFGFFVIKNKIDECD